MDIVTLTLENLDKEHICCAISNSDDCQVASKKEMCIRDSSNSAPSACKHRVSGSLSLPSRGPFHLSLTVLFLYRSSSSI